MKDDFQLEAGSYDYDDDDEWGEDESTWNAEENPQEEEEPTDVKDESTAYLEFLNEEVSYSNNYEDGASLACRLSGAAQANR